MSSDFFSALSGITAIIADAIYPIIFIGFGLFMLLTPYDKYQKIFPVSFSKKAIKAVGVFLCVVGVIYGILMVIGLLNSSGMGKQNETDSETVTQFTSEESGDERREIYEGLKSSSDNPFLLDWNTTLEKSW